MNSSLKIFNDIAHALFEAEANEGVVKPLPYDTLEELLDINLEETSIEEQRFTNALKGLVLNTPRTNTKRFFNQLFGGRNEAAYLGELLAVLLNNSMYTYKVGGPMIKVEKNILKALSDLFGFQVPTEGTIATGGSMTNYMALVMARDKYDDQARFEGVTKRMIAYTSEESHYSVPKNAAFAGIGRHNVRFVATNEVGEMLASDLKRQIQEDIDKGYLPFFVNGTAGTTVLGAFDPIEEIASVCKKYDLWFHLDAAYGGSVIFSDKYKHLIKGAHLTDSVSINAHKMLGTPITCSFIITKHINALYDSFSNEASYLYQGDNDNINPGKISLQCGRRNDALKFWSLWKLVGTNGLGEMVDRSFYLADLVRNYVSNHSDYTLYSFDDSVNICFNYKDIPAKLICQKLHEAGELMVGYGKFRDTTFIRLVTVNFGNSDEDVLKFFEILENFIEREALA